MCSYIDSWCGPVKSGWEKSALTPKRCMSTYHSHANKLTLEKSENALTLWNFIGALFIFGWLRS